MKMFRGDRIPLHLPLLLLFSLSADCGGQPFLNSLAVLFRARPPWPTIFPSNKMTPIPAPFVSMANTQQGILVAHPISPSSSSFETALASASSSSAGTEPGKSKKPDSIGEALDQSLSQPMRSTLPTIPPTLQPLIPIFPQPLPAAFQNDFTRGAVEHAKALGLPPPPSLDQGKAFGNQVSSAEQISSAGHLNIMPSPADLLKPFRVIPSPVDKGAYLEHQQQQQQQNRRQQQQRQQQEQQRQQQEQHHRQQQHEQQRQQQQATPPQHTLLRPSPQRHHHHHQQQGNLVSLPTSVVSTVSLPDVPSTVAQYGIIVDGNLPTSGNSRKKFRYHQHGAHEGKYEVGGSRRHPAWNPLTPATATNYNSNNNHNDSYHNVNNPPFYESSRKHKKLKDFRPSPQLNSFVETTVFTDYATHMNANGGGGAATDAGGSDGRAHHNGNEPPTQPKYESGFRPITFNQYAPNYGTTATRPHYTNSHSQYYNPWSIAFNPDQQQHQQQAQHNQSAENLSAAANNANDNYSGNKSGSQENFELSVEESKGAHRGKPYRKDRKILSSSTLSHEVINNSNESKQSGSYSREDGDGRIVDDAGDVYQRIYIGNRGKTKTSTSSEELRKSRHPFSSIPTGTVVKGKKQVIVSSSSSSNSGIPSATISSTTASSELVEEWLPPGIQIEKKSDGRKKYPTYNKHIRRAHHNPNNNNKPMGLKGLMKLPDKCEKFNRFGFCPVTRQYPLEAAEKIASRCSALLSHLIAPLPKMDVQYDIGEDPKNGSGGGGGGAGGGGGKRSGSTWTWKSYIGKPVCDTDELTTVPGWARNEHGDWLIILQTKAWQQKAHISLCSPAATHCQGLSCANSGATTAANSAERKASGDVAKDTKCVQRFTAQRLAVFDPDNPDRCPVVRSVFLPSACVCLTNRGMTGPAVAPVPNSRERDLDGNYSSSSGRQPLFSSSKEIGGGGEETDDDGGELVRTFPDSAEALSISSSERRASRPIGARRRTVYSSSSVEGRHSNEIQQPTIFTSSKDPRNATFMIITEKFTTKESSKEEIFKPHTVRVVQGATTSSIRVSPR